MNRTIHAQKVLTDKEYRVQYQRQLDEHLLQQPASIQSVHRWMKRLEVAGLGLMAAAFITAMYLSIMWRRFDPLFIPLAWFGFAASIAPTMIFSGLDSILTRAFPTSAIPGSRLPFVTGTGAIWIGAAFIGLALIVVAFWGLFAYATWTQNWSMLQPLIGFMGVVMAAAIVLGMALKAFSKFMK